MTEDIHSESVDDESQLWRRFEISDELIHVEGYLLSRGVRAMALIGTCDADAKVMLDVYNKLMSMSSYGIAPTE